MDVEVLANRSSRSCPHIDTDIDTCRGIFALDGLHAIAHGDPQVGVFFVGEFNK